MNRPMLTRADMSHIVPGLNGRAESCSGGSCGTPKRRRARTRPFPLGASAAAVITYSNNSFRIPAGSKLRLGNSQDAIILSISVDSVPLPQVSQLPAAVLDPAKVLGNPVDFVMPEVTSTVVITFTAAPANPIVAYLDNVPLAVVTKCNVEDDGADARAEWGGVSGQPSVG